MAEYIEREALLKHFQFRIPVESEIGKVYKECAEIGRKLINEAPDADVVEVVRCKDCTEYGRCPICYFHMKSADGFCSKGKRKDGATDTDVGGKDVPDTNVAKMDGKGEE